VDQKWSARPERALASANLASIYVEYGPDPDRGLQLAREARETFRLMGDATWEARSTTTLGIYFMNTGRYSESVEHFQQAERLSRSRDFGWGIAFANYNLGRCYFFQNQYARALVSLEAAFELYQEQQDPFGIALTQILVGWTHARLGDRAKAQALVDEGLRASREKGYGELLPDAYAALGELHREGGDAGRARASYQQGSDLWKEPSVSESSIEARSYLGLLEAERGNRERGLALCSQAAERARRLQHLHSLARALVNLAQVHVLRRDYAQAVEALDEIPSADQQKPGPELRAQALYWRGKALEGLGRDEDARAAYREARETIRSLQLSLAAAHRDTFAARRDIQPLFP
jgi:tetratricopeptide (TPR) repeat protein